MKKVLMILALAAGVTACNENGTSIEVEGDSVKQNLENLGEKVEEKSEQVWDSTKEKAKELKDRIENKFDSVDRRKDTTR